MYRREWLIRRTAPSPSFAVSLLEKRPSAVCPLTTYGHCCRGQGSNEQRASHKKRLKGHSDIVLDRVSSGAGRRCPAHQSEKAKWQNWNGTTSGPLFPNAGVSPVCGPASQSHPGNLLELWVPWPHLHAESLEAQSFSHSPPGESRVHS